MFESRQATIPFPSRLNDYYCDEKNGSYGLQCLDAYSYGKEKDPGSYTLPCYINNVCFENALADLGVSVSVMPLSTYLNIRLVERMELGLEARLMGETLVLNRSLDPLYGDYIELNNLNVLLELRRDQVDDLMPTIEEGE
ncbi:hypothetical protein Tco_1572518, partial [Tanacetum coccineum]